MKIKTILSLFFVIFVTLLDAETLLVLLKGIENNHILHMTYGQKSFVCKPYGVEKYYVQMACCRIVHKIRAVPGAELGKTLGDRLDCWRLGRDSPGFQSLPNWH